MSSKGFESTVSARDFSFTTEEAAEKELTRIKTKQRKEGDNALKLSDSLRIMALERAEKLKPFGKTIIDATGFYLKFASRC